MSFILTWFKKELKFLVESLPEIFKGFVLFLLLFSGLGVAILIRMAGYNGAVIALGGVVVEGFSIVLCYIIFKKYLKSRDENRASEKVKKVSLEAAK